MDFYRLAELAELTGLTPRTIRYYIVEGLLPPPQGAGPAAVYTAAHRDRLRLITALKARYLPLREIRRRLAALSDAQVRAELASGPADLRTVHAIITRRRCLGAQSPPPPHGHKVPLTRKCQWPWTTPIACVTILPVHQGWAPANRHIPGNHETDRNFIALSITRSCIGAMG
jgi:DNA-binding transcriptional MerR regulator